MNALIMLWDVIYPRWVVTDTIFYNKQNRPIYFMVAGCSYKMPFTYDAKEINIVAKETVLGFNLLGFVIFKKFSGKVRT